MIYAVGAQTDRHMGIPGEDLPGSWAATEFVAWYNGHPDFRDLEFDLSCKRAVVIGNGNVAMDVARMLVLPREELEVTDTTDHAIEAIADSGIEEVVILGRRGPAQAAFTNPELLRAGRAHRRRRDRRPRGREARRPQRALDRGRGRPHPAQERGDPHRTTPSCEPSGKRQAGELRFLRSPVEIKGDGKVEAIELVRNELEHGSDGRLRAQATDDHETLESGWCSARSATAACRSRACRSTSGRA